MPDRWSRSRVISPRGQVGEGLVHAAELGVEHRLEGGVVDPLCDVQPPVSEPEDHVLGARHAECAAQRNDIKPTTTLCEAVYPQNRVVVDYGQREDLVLLGATRPDGTDIPLADAADHWQGIGSVIRAHAPVTLTELSRLAASGLDLAGKPVTGIESEGWVIRYQSGVRVKVKQEEYLRLAALVGEIGTEDVWQWTGIARFGQHFPAKYLARALSCPAADITGANGDFEAPMRAAIEKAPDEYHDQVRAAVDQLAWAAGDVFAEMQHRFNQIKTIGDRGDFARAANRIEDSQVRAGVSLLLDGKIEDTKLRAWKSVKPAPERLFRTYTGERPLVASPVRRQRDERFGALAVRFTPAIPGRLDSVDPAALNRTGAACRQWL